MDFIYAMPTWGVWLAGGGIAVLAALIVAALTADDIEMGVIHGGTVLLIVGIVTVAVPFALRWEADYETWCAAQGGHVDTSTSTTVVSTGKGAGVGATTTYYCLSDDGRIIDVQ